MNGFIFWRHIFLALFVSGLFASAFNRVWREEMETESNEKDSKMPSKYGRVAEVFMNGGYIISFLLFVLGNEIWHNGFAKGSQEFANFALGVVISFSLYFLFIYPLMPYLRKRFSARACALLWLVPMYCYYSGVILIYKNYSYIPLLFIRVPTVMANFLLIAWAVGFVAVFGNSILIHILFKNKILKSASVAEEAEILNLLEQTAKELDYRHQIFILVTPDVDTPLAMSGKKEKFVFPMNSDTDHTTFWNGYTQEELHMILLHELHHLQRGDIGTNLFFSFLRAFCWFNPLVWIACRKAAEDMELSCDEIVVKGMDAEQRKSYAKLILTGSPTATGFSTCLSATAESMKYRMSNIIHERKLYRGTILISALIFLMFTCNGLIGFCFERGSMKELIFSESESISAAYVNIMPDPYLYQTLSVDELRLYLNDLQISKLSEIYDYDIAVNYPYLTLFYCNSLITVSDEYVTVRDPDSGKETFYIMDSSINWDVIRDYLKKNNNL